MNFFDIKYYFILISGKQHSGLLYNLESDSPDNSNAHLAP